MTCTAWGVGSSPPARSRISAGSPGAALARPNAISDSTPSVSRRLTRLRSRKAYIRLPKLASARQLPAEMKLVVQHVVVARERLVVAQPLGQADAELGHH